MEYISTMWQQADGPWWGKKSNQPTEFKQVWFLCELRQRAHNPEYHPYLNARHMLEERMLWVLIKINKELHDAVYSSTHLTAAVKLVILRKLWKV